MTTSDLFDEHRESAQTCETQFRSFGGVRAFSGRVATVRCHEDNVVLKAELSKPGDGRVLVVDAGGSFRCAVLGDNIGGLAVANGWAGVVIHGCVRDVAALGELPVGILAVGTNPKPSGKTGAGEAGAAVSFGGCTFRPGDELHADEDGILVLSASAG
jgi:regulator of ribonuclease activity A